MSKNILAQDQKILLTDELTDELMDTVIEAVKPQIREMVAQRMSALRHATEFKCDIDIPTTSEIVNAILLIVPSGELRIRSALEIAEYLQEHYVIVKRTSQNKAHAGR